MASQGTVLPPVKNVTVYRNGDPFFPGRRFVVNHRQVANLESFLNDVTQSIRAPAAVRTLYTPSAGHRVHELEDLCSGAQYVAAGFERFKKLDYMNSGLKPAIHRSDRAQVRTVYRPNVSAKWRKAIHLPCIIHVFRNGDLLCSPLRFIIPRSLMQDLEQILTMVSEKASLRTGAVRRLCTLEGGAVAAGEELESGQYYVAVGTERFKKLPYVELLVPKAPAGHGLRNQYVNSRLPKRYETRKPVSVPQDRYSDSALLDSPESSGRRVKSTGDEAGGGKPKKLGRVLKEEDTLFFAKPAKVHKSRARPRPTQPLRGDAHPSVFKGDLRKEVQGAEEVAEDEDTAVELPVDQRAAETVEDEELNEKDQHETSRDGPDPVRTSEKTSPEPEVGYTTNRSTPTSSREMDDRASSASAMEKQEEIAAPDSRMGSSVTRGTPHFKEEEVDSARQESSQEREEPGPCESRTGSVTYQSYQEPQVAERIRPASGLSANELTA
ncbi:hypothetical protein AAFF_G00184970 [Aldrovandia affinis]|uniref:Doublecortin domain-containing protein n=1 Tax=Aldrovandia affinis TaxID=143900 RepID=A0AAD7W6U3_9TELE|nr:hypothetical protein AAFF_G00184970 [Aldrovandia affinis]